MKESVKQEWVAALRSGHYMQGHGYLRDRDGGHCCLGVLCEIAVKHGVIPPAEIRPGDTVYSYICRDEGYDDIYLPEQVRDWAGLDSCNPTANDITLSMLNDRYHTFDEIAEQIEAHL